jgi:hypothetical protein
VTSVLVCRIHKQTYKNDGTTHPDAVSEPLLSATDAGARTYECEHSTTFCLFCFLNSSTLDLSLLK